MSDTPKLDGVWPKPETILKAIRAMQSEMAKPSRPEPRGIEESRLNTLKRVYMEQRNQ